MLYSLAILNFAVATLLPTSAMASLNLVVGAIMLVCAVYTSVDLALHGDKE